MVAPTETLTQRTAAHLNEEVALAVRVRQGARSGPVAPEYDESDPLPLPAGGLPIVPLLRSMKTFITDLFAGDDVLHAILAFTRSGDRVLLGRARFRSKKPTKTIRRIPDASPISVNMPLLAEHLIPELMLDGERFTVNTIDFGALTRAVVEGDVDDPALASQLAPYYEQAKTFQSYDPNKMRAMIPGQQKSDR